jgi:hypothetical protein
MLRPSELTIDPDDPWANDDLNRKPQGEALRQFISTVRSSFVIALKAPWGTGKSTFLLRLSYHLEPKIPTIRLDAWRNDFMDDPLLAFIGAVNQRLNEKEGPKKASIATFMSAFASIGGKLSGPVLGLLARIVVPGVDAIATAAEALTKTAEVLLAEQENHGKTVQHFRRKLAEARDILTGRKPKELIRPVVFLIDELDRCRPDFAIRTLERIKHFFDVEGVIFLIATDSANLPAAVRSVYGIEQDADRYLRKFIDFEFQLQDPAPEEFIKYLSAQFSLDELLDGQEVDSLVHLMDTQDGSFVAQPYLKKFAVAEAVHYFPSLAKALNLGLRDQIQAFTIVVAAIRSAPTKFVILGRLLIVCAALRFADQEVYEKMLSGEIALSYYLSGNPTNPKTANVRAALMNAERSFSVYLNRVAEISTIEAPSDRQKHLNQQISSRGGDSERVLGPLVTQSNHMRSMKGYLSKLMFLVNNFAPPAQEAMPRGINAGSVGSSSIG